MLRDDDLTDLAFMKKEIQRLKMKLRRWDLSM